MKKKKQNQISFTILLILLLLLIVLHPITFCVDELGSAIFKPTK